MDQVILEVQDVAVHFGGVKAVDGISFDIRPGQIYGILGPNGSGKSTLLGAITRMVDVNRGIIRFEGAECQRLGMARLARLGVARTFQTVRLLPELTVLENVMLGADIAPRERRRRVPARVTARTAVDRAGLHDLERARPGELSYGSQRRVEIARAIAMEPRLLLLDEPTAGMNQLERREVAGLLRSLRDEGLTQLLVEHDVQMMTETCDYVFVMNFGRLIAEGAPADVVREPAVREAYLGRRWKPRA